LMEYHGIVSANTPTIYGLEKGFTLKIGGIVLRGRIDRIDKIDGGFEIIDYKTGTPKDKLTWDLKKQLVLYAIAAQECFDPVLEVKKLTYHYLENNSQISFEPSEKELQKLKDEILSVVEKITFSDFAATPGMQCAWCDFKDICEFSQN
ncbi:PD-(D/E)XK nuclease family protein, partial [Patescibacteria group bacterium]|nr:PD-(D/E)XK nuclease family protein [Patescibacteria group bacterium]